MSELENVKFNLIRYANCWEDADVLLSGLNIREGEKVVSICSAGDNSFSLLSADPEFVIAADINPLQIHLAKLKAAAIEVLEREEYLGFSGYTDTSNRNNTYHLIRNNLAAETRAFWDQQEKAIRDGICHFGKFENYFRIFSGRIMKIIHRQKTIDELFREKSNEDQFQFYENKWNNFRWKLLFRLFFSKPVMGKIGRDPSFLREVKVPVAKYIFDKASVHLRSKFAQDNYMLHYQLKGRFGKSLPHFLREENYKKIKSNLSRLTFSQGYLQDALNKYGTMNAMNLSDIFEYTSEELFSKLASEINKSLLKGGRVAYWNLMVPRNISSVLPVFFTDERIEYPQPDKGFFYKEFIVNRKNE